MTVAEKNIISTFSSLLNSYNHKTKKTIVEHLSKSLKKENKKTEEEFFKTFGGFSDGKSDEIVIDEIKSSRKFMTKDISF
jgi:hypothetical protein